MNDSAAPSFAEIKRRFWEDPRSLVGCIPGIFLISKPRGITSHDAVEIARRRLGIRRIGHGGTLDPFAEGLLILLVGSATRLFPELQGFDKEYRAIARLGVCTDTYDISGRLLATAPPEEVAAITRSKAEEVLSHFRGEISQTPPPYSALKKKGIPYYRLARRGEAIKPAPRRATAYEIELLRFNNSEIEFRLRVASGFYVRSLAHEFGQRLGVGAALTSLIRVRIGPFSLTEALRADELIRPAPGHRLCPQP